MMLKTKLPASVLFLCLLAFGLALLFWKVFLLREVIVPGDIVWSDPVMQPAKPAGFVRAQNPLLADHIYQSYVWHSLAAKAMQHGSIPFWNPYMLAGQPLVANAQPALFYPTHLLMFWLSPGVVTNLTVFFNVLVAGLCTFGLCRALQISPFGAGLAGVAFALSGPIIVGPAYAYANSLVWLPLLLWAGEKLLVRDRAPIWCAAFGLGLGLSILGGHPETTFHVVLAAGLYLAARLACLALPLAARFRALGWLAVATLLGLLLGAIQWLPFAVLLQHSATITRSRSSLAAPWLYTSEWWPNLASVVTLLLPNFFGHPADYTYVWPFANYQNFLEQSMYFGLAPLALAAAAVLGRRSRTAPVVILALLAVLTLAVALRLPGFEAVNHWPVFDRANNTRLKWIFTCLGSVLAGFGYDALVGSHSADQAAARPMQRVMVLVPLAALAACAVMIAYRLGGALPGVSRLATMLPDNFRLLPPLSTPRTVVSMGVAAALLLFAVAYRRRPLLRRSTGFILIGLTFVELIAMGWGYNATVPARTIYPSVPLTAFLAQDRDLFRVLAIPPAFWPNYAAVYGIFEIGGYDLPVLERSSNVYLAQGGQGYRQNWSPDWPLVDWMNVKYVVSPHTLQLDKLELVLDDGGYKLYHNKSALPRAFIVYQVEVIADDATALQTLVSGRFDFAHVALLAAELPPDQRAALVASASLRQPPASRVEFRQFANDQVVLIADLQAAGLLVMSDVYTDGWQVAVDGQRQALHRANYAYRGVYLPAGRHVVEFTYRPVEARVGGTLSLLGLVSLGALVAAYLRMRAADMPLSTRA